MSAVRLCPVMRPSSNSPTTSDSSRSLTIGEKEVSSLPSIHDFFWKIVGAEGLREVPGVLLLHFPSSFTSLSCSIVSRDSFFLLPHLYVFLNLVEFSFSWMKAGLNYSDISQLVDQWGILCKREMIVNGKQLLNLPAPILARLGLPLGIEAAILKLARFHSNEYPCWFFVASYDAVPQLLPLQKTPNPTYFLLVLDLRLCLPLVERRNGWKVLFSPQTMSHRRIGT